MKRHVLQGGIVAAALASAVAAGCNREPEPAVPQTAQQTAAPVDDDRLATYVQSRFYADRAIRGSDIDVSAENGVVTLSGTVESEDVKQQALAAARQVDGVTSVQDRLRVEAAAAPDATTAANRPVEGGAQRDDERTPGWITTKIQSQFFLNPDIKPWNIDVSTSQEGVVTLKGEVDEAKDRQEAERIARTTDGVTRVVNRLQVRGERPMAQTGAEAGQPGEADRPDAWITAKIQAKYFLDDEVKALDINVDTSDGVVTLKGEVENEAARRQAIALARNTEGVKSVTDQLKLAPAEAERTSAQTRTGDREAAPKAAEKRPATTVDDAWITTKIQSKYFLDTDVKGRNINVDTRNGIVTLTGTVESDAERQSAVAIAQETEGVTRVNSNQLKVETAEKR